jgi:hypothetical protein
MIAIATSKPSRVPKLLSVGNSIFFPSSSFHIMLAGIQWKLSFLLTSSLRNSEETAKKTISIG